MQHMLKSITDHGMFHDKEHNKGLWNFLAGKEATSEQAHDLLKFREIGQEDFEHYALAKYLKQTSTAAPVRRKRLCTISTSQAEKRRVKQIEKERKLHQRYLKRTIAWVAEHGSDGTDMEVLLGPISPVPRALIDYLTKVTRVLPPHTSSAATKILQPKLRRCLLDGFLIV